MSCGHADELLKVVRLRIGGNPEIRLDGATVHVTWSRRFGYVARVAELAGRHDHLNAFLTFDAVDRLAEDRHAQATTIAGALQAILDHEDEVDRREALNEDGIAQEVAR